MLEKGLILVIANSTLSFPFFFIVLETFPCVLIDDATLTKSGEESVNHGTQIVMDNPNSPNEPNVDISEENPVIPEPNHVEDAHDPNEMVDIPDDVDLVDHDGDDKEPQKEPEEEPKEEPEQQIGHENQFAQHPNLQPGPSTAAIEVPSFPLPAPGLHVPHTVIEDLSTHLGNLDYRHGVLMRKMKEVQVMESQAVQVVSGLKEIETRVQQVESRVDTYSSGQLAVPRQDEIIGLSQQVQTLQTALHGTKLQNHQLRTRVAETESHV
nr:hypothetical protein [Tanacetum cinerariifolium]